MEKISELIDKFQKGSLTDEELRQLMNYLQAAEPSEPMKKILSRAWDTSPGCNPQVDSQALYLNLSKRLGLVSQWKGSAEERAHKGIREMIFSVLKYAAVFLIAFCLSLLIRPVFHQAGKSESISHLQQMEVPYGSKSRIILPDGSEVILNSGSSLAYDIKEFGAKERKIYMKGEAFFSVTKNPSLPFYVHTPAMIIKVKGTTFNVKAYPDEKTEETLLINGSVEIFARSENDKNSVKLNVPNQRAVFVKQEAEIEVTEPQREVIEEKSSQVQLVEVQGGERVKNSIAWKDDMLVFDNEPFTTLVTRLERWYNVNIKVQYPDLEKARFTGKFDKESLDQVLKALTTLIPFDYTIKQNTVTIFQYNQKKMPMKHT